MQWENNSAITSTTSSICSRCRKQIEEVVEVIALIPDFMFNNGESVSGEKLESSRGISPQAVKLGGSFNHVYRHL